MAIYEITKKSDWHEPIAQQMPIAFLQSWEFGDFLSQIGRKVQRWGIVDSPEEQIQGIISPTRLGSFVYLPHAHITPKGLQEFLEYFKKNHTAFVRIEPILPISPRGFHHRSIPNRQAQHHWVFDVTPEEDALLGSMHAKTRYNIRLAGKKGVEIREEKNPALFLALEQSTARRKGGFDSPQNLEYYTTLLSLPTSYQTTAYYENIPVASSILLYLNGVLTYLFGGSNNAYHAVMAPTLLQWYNINLTKRLGGTYYNFLGVAGPTTETASAHDSFHGYTWDTTHPYSVLTRFKAGFGGKVQSLANAEDIILSKPAYIVHQIAEAYRRRS